MIKLFLSLLCALGLYTKKIDLEELKARVCTGNWTTLKDFEELTKDVQISERHYFASQPLCCGMTLPELLVRKNNDGHVLIMQKLEREWEIDLLKTNDKKQNLLHMLCQYDHPNHKLLDYFISRGFDVNAQDGYGKTPLHYAAERSNVGLVKALLDYGAKKDLADFHGILPVSYAQKDLKGKRKDLAQEVISLLKK